MHCNGNNNRLVLQAVEAQMRWNGYTYKSLLRVADGIYADVITVIQKILTEFGPWAIDIVGRS
jgi:hypothetical protein